MTRKLEEKDVGHVTEWRAQPGPQEEALMRSEKEIGFGGARFGGKTEAGQAWIAEPEYMYNPEYRSLVIRKDYDDLSDWLFRAKIFYSGLAEIVGNPPVVKWKNGGITRCGHWKDKNTISKYIGHEYHKMLFEELNQSIRTEEEYTMLLGSVRSTVSGLRAQIMSTFNPGGKGHHWIKKYFVDKARNKAYKDPNTGYTRIFIPSKYTDNPLGCKADPEYVQFLMGLQGALGRAWREGDFEAFEGQYFANFGNHMKEDPFMLEPAKHAKRLYASYDYGFGLHGISSCGFWMLDDHGVPHRCYTRRYIGMNASEQAADLFDYMSSFHLTSGMLPVEFVYDNNMDNLAGMKADDWSAIDYFKHAFRTAPNGLVWTPATKARVIGWQVVLDYFGRDVNTKLPKMRYWDGYNASWEESWPMMTRDDNNPDDCEKCAIDHPCDETRYMLVKLRRLQANLEGSQATFGGVSELAQDPNTILRQMELSGRIGVTGI